jgi:hypothetical protein
MITSEVTVGAVLCADHITIANPFSVDLPVPIKVSAASRTFPPVGVSRGYVCAKIAKSDSCLAALPVVDSALGQGGNNIIPLSEADNRVPSERLRAPDASPKKH